MSRYRTLDHSFGRGEPFTIGLEEELLLVDPESLALSHTADRVLPDLDLYPDRAGHEAFLAEVELRSGPRGRAADAATELEATRTAVRVAGATLMAVGLHPDAELGDVKLTPAERYEALEQRLRGLIRRTPECALHVHVGIPDADAACRALTALREALPLLQGLAASSPFWFGRDSGLDSARSAMVRGYPGRGAPPPMAGWTDYLAELEAVAKGAGPDDPRSAMTWWDVRLQPRLGTVEMRELDVQARLDDVAGIAALVRALAERGVDRLIADPAPAAALAWSWFNASRDGLDALILHRGRRVPLRVAASVELAGLAGGAPELQGVARILSDGNGASRQRAAFARGGMRSLLEHLVDETALPLGGTTQRREER